ncbi:MAG: acyl-CoA dehydrogenase [Lentisphaerae bacterium]|jgi:3-(methylthio)propanoyl-CoA dehydrogenase|nr:acyl-CoA dehydrogenase [Lentisphaerota bacterium]MBT5608428.1 acyl-CoA dehydrogenase [Lentisphaerota bacterium]MBT7055046.1 acyl-CoA dehydrogenase [Lentisphaerota bacterium]MBT7847766.1 acyl-CoA dehydrogenase [Lentisphaerota bacterium]
MAENFYLDNPDIKFHLSSIGLDDVVRMFEDDYAQTADYAEAPEDFEDALDSYDRVMAMVGEICGDKIAPRAEDVDHAGATLENGVVSYAPGTDENLRDLQMAQVMGVMLPRRYGGLNMPCTVYTMMTEMVSRADCSLQNLFGLQDIAQTIYFFGDEDQKQRYLPRLASGEADGAMSLTEPEAGSDLQAVQLKAWQDEDTGKWYLNGMKRFITNGCAKIHLVLARSEEGSKDGRGLSMFVCERGPELVVRRIEDKLGIHGSPTCELQFNDVPAELVGQRRRGLTRYIMSLMNGARVAISGQAIGVAEAAYRAALDYARARDQFGKTIDNFPAVYEMLVASKVQIVASRTLLYETTKYVDLRDRYELLVDNTPRDQLSADDRAKAKMYVKLCAELTPLTKALSTEVANRVAYDGIQVHGGTGFMRDFPAERYYRDARITNIYEGTTQLQHVAAIGGVVQRVVDPLIEELRDLSFKGKLRRLASSVDMGLEKLRRAVEHVTHEDDSDYRDLMARRLCDMETIVYVSYLMLRDALNDKSRECLVERYVLDMLPILEMHYNVIMNHDFSLIDRHQDILEK